MTIKELRKYYLEKLNLYDNDLHLSLDDEDYPGCHEAQVRLKMTSEFIGKLDELEDNVQNT
jgi:hypothetical protein